MGLSDSKPYVTSSVTIAIGIEMLRQAQHDISELKHIDSDVKLN